MLYLILGSRICYRFSENDAAFDLAWAAKSAKEHVKRFSGNMVLLITVLTYYEGYRKPVPC